MNDRGMKLLAEVEGLAPRDTDGRFKAYWDADGGVWTGPYGITVGVTEASRWTDEEARTDMLALLAKFEEGVNEACTLPANENEHAAMLILAWNIGLGWKGGKKPAGAKDGFRQSTVLRAHNRGDKTAAANAFGLWNKSGGKVNAGLVRRRKLEAALYLEPVAGAARLAMPQAVEPESKPHQSPVIVGSTITATVSVAAEVSRQVKDIRDSLGDLLPWVLVAIAVAGAGWAIWGRIQQRKGGWA